MTFLDGIDSSWTLFLDRDGVINQRKWGGYIQTREEFVFLDGVKEAIAVFSERFRYIFVVTNQQGIGKGLMTVRNLEEIHRYMSGEIEAAGGKLTKCYFAPELKQENSSLRKPNSGMALQAAKDYEGIDFAKSVMVGDTDSDIEFGKRLGMKTVRVKTDEPENTEADLVVNSLKELSKLLM